MLARFGCPSSCKPASSRNYCSKAPAAAMSTRRCRSAVNSRSMVAGRREEEEEEEWMRFEVLAHLEPWAEAHMLPLLKPADEAWQPSDLLPDAAALGADGFHQACLDLRARAEGVPDAQLVCLVGNMVTEEALPTYQSMSNRFEATRDATGADGTAWARWIRGWSAEENRHGDVLSRYMSLSGRLDMRQVERTVHRLIASGMAMHAPASSYHGFVDVAF
ncbi:acyl-[acyl-carrier-protein] desaturase 7, chloroplastic-like [Lolium perenne]|uniref:acyl-[acyl-carrier-protein] desaturase 7, chloroplastic-like n=1 Tax=Lolium perenne TaxID=4522 RepID=UPI0021F5F970|nr:acyl-[acyl-carrier-protein] desaturase 7, chloroplastic-like [Lolium perenne]